MHDVRLCDTCEGRVLAAETQAAWKKNRRDVLLYGGVALLTLGLALVAAHKMIPRELPLGEVLP